MLVNMTKEDFRNKLENGEIVLHMIDTCIYEEVMFDIETNESDNTVVLKVKES